jgi:hypothetical protein
MATIYAGPGKVFRAADTTVVGGVTASASATAFQAEGENGLVNVAVSEPTAEYAAAMFGRIGEQTVDLIGEITFRPFDNWGSLAQLYPPWVGVTVGGTTGALQIGGRPHGTGSSKVQTKVWTPDGRLYTFVRTAVVGHPSLHLGVGKALFGDAKILAIGDETLSLGASSFLISGNAITESGAADPGGNFTMADFERGAWTGAWGIVAGFGGDGGGAMQAEDEWTIEFTAKYDMLKVQGRTYAAKLSSVNAMARLKPYGPTHTNIIARVGAHTQGQRLGSADLVLTGPSSKTITLKNAEVKGAGFIFGGATLGTGEIGFVVEQTFTTGAPQPILIFSA